jgi:hypothetical protein
MRPSRLVLLAIAGSVLTISAGCSKTSPSAGLRPLPIPTLDTEATTPCPDPLIDRNPKVAVVEHRRALAICEERRSLAVDAYIAVQNEFGVKR